MPWLGSGRPTCDAGDFDSFLQELRRRGYGWLRPEGVRRQWERQPEQTDSQTVPAAPDADSTAGSSDSLNNRGVDLAELDETEKAVGLWEEAVIADLTHPEAVYNLAVTEWRAGYWTDVEVLRLLEPCKAADGPRRCP